MTRKCPVHKVQIRQGKGHLGKGKCSRGRYTGQRPYKLHAPDDSRIAKATVPFSWSLAQLVTTAAVHVRNGQGGETGSVKRVRGSARFWTWNHRAWLVLGSGR